MATYSLVAFDDETSLLSLVEKYEDEDEANTAYNAYSVVFPGIDFDVFCGDIQ